MAAVSSMAAVKTEIRGRVLLREEPVKYGDYVMVYAKSFNSGTLSDEFGQFSLSLVTAAPKEVKIEFSRIGYATLTETVNLVGGTVDLGDIYLDVQHLMLAAAYVTPDGKSPGEAVMAKLWEQGKLLKNNRFDYRANISYDMATHEIPLVASVLPKGTVGFAKFIGATQGYGPLFRYCLKNDDFSAKASLGRQVKGNQTTNYNKKLISSDKPLPDNVKQNVLGIFDFIDLFDLVYGDANSWGEKWAKKHKFRLVGTYEYGDKLVDVLKYTDRHSRGTINLHIVEEEWAILKIQVYTKEGEVLRCESRDVGNGMYMPISFVLKPSVTMIRAEQIPELIEEVKKSKDFNAKTKEKMIKVLEERQGTDFNPYISVGCNVRYTLL